MPYHVWLRRWRWQCLGFVFYIHMFIFIFSITLAAIAKEEWTISIHDDQIICIFTRCLIQWRKCSIGQIWREMKTIYTHYQFKLWYYFCICFVFKREFRIHSLRAKTTIQFMYSHKSSYTIIIFSKTNKQMAWMQMQMQKWWSFQWRKYILFLFRLIQSTKELGQVTTIQMCNEQIAIIPRALVIIEIELIANALHSRLCWYVVLS